MFILCDYDINYKILLKNTTENEMQLECIEDIFKLNT